MKKTYVNRHTIEGDVLKEPRYLPGDPSRLLVTVVTREERVDERTGHTSIATPYHDVVLYGDLADRFAPGTGNELEAGEYVHLEGAARSREHRVEVHAYKFHVVAEDCV